MRVLILVRGTAAAAAAAVVFGSMACKSDPPKKAAAATPVRVAQAIVTNAPVNVLASGVVEPMQTVAVTAQVSGSLLDVAFKEGDFVQKGQVLFHIDPRPLQAAVDQSKATLARDEAQAAAAKKDDERYTKLADMGYVSRSQADQMHAQAQAQAATVEADRASLRSAEVNLGFSTVRAPIDGRTGSILMRQGNNVSPGGGPLVVINQLSPVLVRFPVLGSDFPVLQRAVAVHPLTVTAAAGDSATTSETGQLSFLDNTIDSLTGTVTGKARFENHGRRMWPGELVFLTVQVDVQRGVVAIPTEAVQTGQQGAYVYVVDAKNTAQTRNVTTGIQLQDLTVVRSGIKAGERVVTDGQSRINPGSKVAVITGSDTSGVGGGATQPGTSSAQAAGDVVAGRAGGAGSASNGDVGSTAGNGGSQGGASTSGGAGRGGNGGSGAAPAGVAGTPGAQTQNLVRPPTPVTNGTPVTTTTTTPAGGRPPTGTTTPTTTPTTTTPPPATRPPGGTPR